MPPKPKTVKRYKFLRLENGEIVSEFNRKCFWTLGEWKKSSSKKLVMCKTGLHCSKNPYQAFTYVTGEILAEVECRGKSEVSDTKETWKEQRIRRAWYWTKKDSVALSIFAAELCLDEFEKYDKKDKRPRKAIEAAKKWLDKPTKKNASAAESAARAAESAAWSAVESAARAARAAESAAESAARSAESAARSAVESAAWSAAWSAARSAESAAQKRRNAAFSAFMKARIKELEEVIE